MAEEQNMTWLLERVKRLEKERTVHNNKYEILEIDNGKANLSQGLKKILKTKALRKLRNVSTDASKITIKGGSHDSLPINTSADHITISMPTSEPRQPLTTTVFDSTDAKITAKINYLHQRIDKYNIFTRRIVSADIAHIENNVQKDNPVLYHPTEGVFRKKNESKGDAKMVVPSMAFKTKTSAGRVRRLVSAQLKKRQSEHRVDTKTIPNTNITPNTACSKALALYSKKSNRIHKTFNPIQEITLEAERRKKTQTTADVTSMAQLKFLKGRLASQPLILSAPKSIQCSFDNDTQPKSITVYDNIRKGSALLVKQGSKDSLKEPSAVVRSKILTILGKSLDSKEETDNHPIQRDRWQKGSQPPDNQSADTNPQVLIKDHVPRMLLGRRTSSKENFLKTSMESSLAEPQAARGSIDIFSKKHHQPIIMRRVAFQPKSVQKTGKFNLTRAFHPKSSPKSGDSIHSWRGVREDFNARIDDESCLEQF